MVKKAKSAISDDKATRVKKQANKDTALRPKKLSVGARRISKQKHKLAQGSKQHPLLPKLQAEAPTAKNKLRSKQAKRTAKASVLGAVSSMRESLEELVSTVETSAQKRENVSISGKRRLKLVAEETQHLCAVLEHPAFIADPFAALQEHLRNTVAPKR